MANTGAGATLTTGGDNTSTTFSGVIQDGAGATGLTKEGAGTFTLSGANTYSGGTLLAAGTLRLENNQALGTGALTTTGSVVDYAHGVTIANPIVVNSNTTQLSVTAGTATQAGAISELNGPRPLEKIGAGTLVLTAANTYSGATTITAGILMVNGSIANSAVTVNSGAILTGIGTVGATTINGGGTFAPGPAGTPGSMTVQGNLAFQSGALYLVQANPSNASSANMIAGGAATLAGTVQAVFASGSYASRTFTILTAAGGLAGTTFNALATTNLPAGFTPSLSYSNTEVTLNLTAALGAVGLSGNQQNVAGTLNNFFNNGGTLPRGFVSVFGLTGGNLGNALSLLSGEAATGAQRVLPADKSVSRHHARSVRLWQRRHRARWAGTGFCGRAAGPTRGGHPRLCQSGEGAGLQGAAADLRAALDRVGGSYGGYNHTDGDPAVVGSHDLTARTFGFAGGFDYHSHATPLPALRSPAVAPIGAWRRASAAAGATRSRPASTPPPAPARYLAGALAFTNHWMSTDRFAAFGDHLTADFNAQSFGGRVESGYRFGNRSSG